MMKPLSGAAKLNHETRRLTYISIIQVIAGFTSLVLGLVSTTAYRQYGSNAIAGGIWCGVFSVITGAVGLHSISKMNDASDRKTMSLYRVLNTVSAFIIIVALVFQFYTCIKSHAFPAGAMAVSVILILVFVIDLVCSIVAGAFACACNCNCGCGPPVVVDEFDVEENAVEEKELCNGLKATPKQQLIPAGESQKSIPNAQSLFLHQLREQLRERQRKENEKQKKQELLQLQDQQQQQLQQLLQLQEQQQQMEQYQQQQMERYQQQMQKYHLQQQSGENEEIGQQQQQSIQGSVTADTEEDVLVNTSEVGTYEIKNHDSPWDNQQEPQIEIRQEDIASTSDPMDAENEEETASHSSEEEPLQKQENVGTD